MCVSFFYGGIPTFCLRFPVPRREGRRKPGRWEMLRRLVDFELCGVSIDMFIDHGSSPNCRSAGSRWGLPIPSGSPPALKEEGLGQVLVHCAKRGRLKKKKKADAEDGPTLPTPSASPWGVLLRKQSESALRTELENPCLVAVRKRQPCLC